MNSKGKLSLATILFLFSGAVFGQIIPDAFFQDSKEKLNKGQLKSAITFAKIAANLDTTKARFVAYQGFLNTVGLNKKVSKENLDKAEKIEPEYGRTYIFRAFWIETFKDAYEYRDSIESLLDKGVSLARNDKEMAEFLNDRATQLQRLGQLSESVIEDFEKASNLKVENTEYSKNLAKALHKAGNFEKSNEIYNKVLENDSSNFSTLSNIALNHVLLEEYQEAMDIYSQLLARDSQDPFTNNQIGFAYFKMGNYKEAMRYVNRSIKNNKSNPAAFRNRAYIRISNNNIKAACKDIRKANAKGFKNDPNNNLADLKEIVCKQKDLESAKSQIGL